MIFMLTDSLLTIGLRVQRPIRFEQRKDLDRPVNLPALTDEQLLAQIARQNAEALEILYDRHAQVVYSLLLRILRNQTSAEEVLQDVFWQVWISADSYRGSGSAAAWIYRIARNKALNQLRRLKRSTESGEVEYLDALANTREAASVSAGSDIEQTAERNWHAQQVRSALQSLPEEQRICVELAYFDGLSQSQIAELLRLPLGTVKTRLRLGMEKLERLLLAAGLRGSEALR